MSTYDVTGGHISDYTSEAYYRACFLEAFALAVSERADNDALPNADAWKGLFLVTLDFTEFLRALNARAQEG
jgi:hypothetical protein